MRKLLSFLLVLSLASMANAALLLSVNGTVDPADTTISLTPDGTATIGVYNSVEIPSGQYPSGILFVTGAGAINAGSPTVWHDSSAGNVDPTAIPEWVTYLAGFGYPGATSVVEWFIGDSTPNTSEPFFLPVPVGTALGNMTFTCTGAGDAKIVLAKIVVDQQSNESLVEFDTQIIHQIPEPLTLTLMGLGGLVLARRRRG